MSQTYVYSIADDTANGKCNPAVLQEEILTAALGQTLDQISTTGDVLDITFAAALSGADETALDAVVAAHVGVVLTDQALSGASEGNSETTEASTYQSKLSVTADALTGGMWVLNWSFEIRVTDETDVCQARVQLAGVDVGESNNATDEWHGCSGFFIQQFDDGETPAFNIAYRVQGAGGDTAAIRRARLVIEPLDE